MYKLILIALMFFTVALSADSDAKWAPPDFSNQKEALGWTPDVFKVPQGMEQRVQFWRDIYTKYGSDQGVLHDSRYVQLVYETVDFRDIMARKDLSDTQKRRARIKLVKQMKRDIAARLRRLQTVKDPAQLTGDDKRYWDMFKDITEPKKFIEAAGRHRLRFQLGQKDAFISGIMQSGRYLHQMENIFHQEGLPIELTRLVFVESSFNLKARSRVGASGIWQFMRTTARRYLRMDRAQDQRNDPLLATRAAAEKLRDNYQMLGNWPLAVTAYNHGPNGVRRLTEKFGTKDIVELTDVRRGRFGFASANFYASFLAALDVEQNAMKYFGNNLQILPEVKGTEVRLQKTCSADCILKWFNGDLAMAKLLNPDISSSVWKGRRSLGRRDVLRVPENQALEAENQIGEAN